MSSFITADGAHICTPFRPDLATLIPHARTLDYRGERMLVMPNRPDENKLARNLGVAVPSPILTRYDWCRHSPAPWEVQRTTAALLSESTRAFVLSTYGCGKTRATCYAFDYLIKEGRAKRVLVSAPLSTLTPVWEDEMFSRFHHLSYAVLHGSRAKRLKLLARGDQVCIINHHGVHMIEQELAEAGFDVVVVDELAVLRNKQTQLWKSHATVVAKARYAWGLTGSPTPMAPTDAWAQIKLLAPARAGRSMASFQDQTMRRISQFRWVARPEANEIVHQAMQPSVRFTLDDINELPATSYIDRKVVLDPLAARAYKMLFDRMSTLTSKGQTVTAVNEGVLQSKLLQVACGYIYTDKVGGEKQVYALPNAPRLEALEETIAGTDRKVIVFVPFIHAIEGVAAHLRAQGHDIAVVHGGVGRSQRDLIFRGFQHEASPRILVAHPACMAHGLTLTAANVIVWYAPVQSLDTYSQANARIVRPGQTAKTLICHLIGTAVERVTYARLKSRDTMQGLLLALFRQQELDF